MARASHQKLKIISLAKILTEQTDEQHPLSANALVTELARFGIPAERKSVYDDIEVLRSFGMDIQNRRRHPAGFYLAERRFSEGELRLLIDAVTAAPFISESKAHKLQEKLAGLASTHRRNHLRPQFSGEHHANARDEELYQCIDEIRSAMEQDVQISFLYYQWTTDKKYRPRKGGARYRVSPWGVIWNEGSYYLIGIDEHSRIVKHYRIDKIEQVLLERGRRSGHDLFEHFDAPEFAARTFGMFGGREESVTLSFSDALIGVLIDRFGEQVRIIPGEDGHFTALLRVTVSRQFYGWLAGLGADARILAPDSVKREYQRFLKKTLELYEARG